MACFLEVKSILRRTEPARRLAAQNAGPAGALSPPRVYFPRQREVLDAAYNVMSTLLNTNA